jgi:hypothetical protein
VGKGRSIKKMINQTKNRNKTIRNIKNSEEQIDKKIQKKADTAISKPILI